MQSASIDCKLKWCWFWSGNVKRLEWWLGRIVKLIWAKSRDRSIEVCKRNSMGLLEIGNYLKLKIENWEIENGITWNWADHQFFLLWRLIIRLIMVSSGWWSKSTKLSDFCQICHHILWSNWNLTKYADFFSFQKGILAKVFSQEIGLCM